MESISQLREICQTTAHKDRSNIYMRYVSRFFSIFVTRFLIPLPVTPNQASFLMIVTGVLANIFLISISTTFFVAGALLLQFWYILDCVDGELARYRHYQITGSKTMDKRELSLEGMYYDVINHYIVNFLVPAALSFSLFRQTGNSNYILIGFAGSLAQVLMLAVFDARYRTICTHLNKLEQARVVKYDSQEGKESIANKSPLHLIFSVVHNTLTYPAVMNLILLVAVLEILIPTNIWRIGTLFYLAAGTTVVSTALISKTILDKAVTQEFKSRFENK